jgi:hypothetical protein
MGAQVTRKTFGVVEAGGPVAESGDGFWHSQLDDEAGRRRDEAAFHVFAESMHSDVRGQIVNLTPGVQLPPPGFGWPPFVFIFIGVSGAANVEVEDRSFEIVPLTQLVVLPGHRWRLTTDSEASVEILSLLSTPPHSEQARQPDAP